MSAPPTPPIALATATPAEPVASYTNEGSGAFRYEPPQLALALDPALVRRHTPDADSARLIPPAGWRLAAGAATQPLAGESPAWTVAPGGRPRACLQVARCDLLAGGRVVATLDLPLRVELRGHSQFDPARDAPPFRNSPTDLGAVEPRRDLFARTFRRGGTILPDTFFDGLYRDIVFLAAGTDARGGGGLCTGMSRFALECSLAGSPPRPTTAREAVQVWHGRQLGDAALLAAAGQFLRPSAAASFRHFRDQVLDGANATVAFDIGIARWDWSPRTWVATFRRLVTQGHTIVPFAFRQADDEVAEVQVYDPSYPAPEDQPRNVMSFDLARERYTYRGFGSLAADDHTTVLAVSQRPFERPGTAYLASLASAVTHPRAALAELRALGVARRRLFTGTAVALVARGVLARRGGQVRRGTD